MSRIIDSILLPTDGSEGAITGAKHGIALASRTGADVHVLSVVETDAETDELEDAGALSTLEQNAQEATETVARLAREFDDELDVTTTVERGTPFQSIREYAHRRGIDVIAIGTRGRSGLERILLGSVTENVLRTARTPVVAVPPDADVETIDDVAFGDMLLPTDGSEGAAIATEWGIALATLLDSMVHSVYSVDTNAFAGAQDPRELLDALERRGEAALETVRERARSADVTVSGSIASGAPAAVITEYATDQDVDLIVMGTHGRTGIGQWFLGSVTENVVRQTEVPVFCVPVSAPSP
ncbi:universal stress protein [Natronoarchaeum mannanilyticum]|uniref:Universal stress protein n=1 Tax=Natronoarchaeum mannanilyticum TaxID=926360 RepID=A0AAV3T4M8_9EURY